MTVIERERVRAAVDRALSKAAQVRMCGNSVCPPNRGLQLR